MNGLGKKVGTIRLYKGAIIYNEHHQKQYMVRKYAEIEFLNGEIIQLDIEGQADITNTYLKVVDKGKLVKEIFKNAIL